MPPLTVKKPVDTIINGNVMLITDHYNFMSSNDYKFLIIFYEESLSKPTSFFNQHFLALTHLISSIFIQIIISCLYSVGELFRWEERGKKQQI